MRISEVNRIVDEILANFNFEKVRLAMFAVDWKWRGCDTPTIEQLREEGRRLLLSVCASPDAETSCCCGGFVASKSGSEVNLAFELECYAVAREMEVL